MQPSDNNNKKKNLTQHYISGCLLSLFVWLSFISACSLSDTPHHKNKHTDSSFAADISENGDYSIVTSTQQPASLWNLKTNQLIYYFSHTEQNLAGVKRAAIADNNQYVLTADDYQIVLWGIETGRPLQSWNLVNKILAIDLSPNGQFALIGYQSGQSHYIDLYSGKTLYYFQHKGPVNSVAISNDGHFAATGSDDKMVKVWNLKSGRLTQQWKQNNSVVKVVFSPKTNYVMSNAAMADIRIWNIHNGDLVKRLDSAPTTISAAAFSPDEQYLATGSPPQMLKLWEIRSGRETQHWVLEKKSFWKPTATVIHDIAFTHNGSHLVTEDSSGIECKWLIPATKTNDKTSLKM